MEHLLSNIFLIIVLYHQGFQYQENSLHIYAMKSIKLYLLSKMLIQLHLHGDYLYQYIGLFNEILVIK